MKSNGYPPGALLMGGLLWASFQLFSQEPPKPEPHEPVKRKIYTNEDLEKLQPPGWKKMKQPSSREAGTSQPGKISSSTLENFRDQNGHGREYWRPKSQALRKKLNAIETEIGRTEQQLKEARSAKGVSVTRQGTYRVSGEVQAFARRLEQQTRERDALLADLAALEEEARKAGALPEWLR
jgi:hypothetical protein